MRRGGRAGEGEEKEEEEAETEDADGGSYRLVSVILTEGDQGHDDRGLTISLPGGGIGSR